MRALSVRQPWLWAMLDIPSSNGPKRDENRKWAACNYRGPVLLHSSTGGKKECAANVAAVALAQQQLGHTPTPPPEVFERGGFRGIARIVAVLPGPESTHGYRMSGHLTLVLADVRRLPHVPARGALGIYRVDHAPGYRGPDVPELVDFGEHAAAYAAAWAELAALADGGEPRPRSDPITTTPSVPTACCPVKHCRKSHPVEHVTEFGCPSCSIGAQQVLAYAKHRDRILASPAYAESVARWEHTYYRPTGPFTREA